MVPNSRQLYVAKATVDNKKTHPPVFQPFVFPVYLRNRLTYNKSVYIFLHHFLKSFQLEQEFKLREEKKKTR